MKSYQFAPVDLIIETSNESRSYILTTDLTSRTNYKPFCDEIEYFLSRNEVNPAVAIHYKRTAFFGKEDKDFRLTFDNHIIYIRFSHYYEDLRLP